MRTNSILNHLISLISLPGTVTVLIPYLLYHYIPVPEITGDHVVLKIAGFSFLILGLILVFCSVFSFGIYGKGTLAPWSPPSELVISGPYKYVRNPMILGVISVLLGEAFILNMISILVWAMIFFIINHVYFEWVEEPKLERKYGEPYVHYSMQVRRWLPKWTPYRNVS